MCKSMTKQYFMCMAILTALLQLGMSHVFMQFPPSRRNKYSEYYLKHGIVDYNIMAPLNSGYSFPCKGFPKGPPTATFRSHEIQIKFEGSAIHNGGHCQFGISYDDTTFVVIHTIVRNCFLQGMSYVINLPINMPGGDFTLFWTWINSVGNREYYMECADVRLENGNAESDVRIQGKELLVVNLPGYTQIPEFPLAHMYDGTDLLDSRKDVAIVAHRTSPIQAVPSATPC